MEFGAVQDIMSCDLLRVLGLALAVVRWPAASVVPVGLGDPSWCFDALLMTPRRERALWKL